MGYFIAVIGSLIVGFGLGYGFRGWTHKQIGSAAKIVGEVKSKL